jgi:hypothetical protein
MDQILIDCRAFSLQKRGGVSQIWAKFLGHSELYDMFNVVLVLYPNYNENIHLQQISDKIHKKADKVFIDIPPSDNQNHNQKKHKEYRIHLIKKSLKKDPILVINTYYGENIYPFTNKYCVIFHDFAHEELDFLKVKKTTSSVINRKKEAITNAGLLFFVSNTSLQKGKLFYPSIKQKKTIVIYHGHNENIINLKKKKGQIIHVGERDGYKNFSLIRNNFDLISKTFPHVSMIIAGGSNPNDEEQNFLQKYPDKIRFINNITDDEMDKLVAASEIYVSCSQYEGFGIPVLNALRLKTKALLSDIAIYREITNNESFYFENNNITSFMNNLKIALNSQSLNDAYNRTWADVFNEYLTAIEHYCYG